MNWDHHWLTVAEFARMMGRSTRQVRYWTSNGTLLEFGYPVYCVSPGRFNRHTFYILNRS